MNKKSKNLYYTLGANILNFVMGIVTGFIIPKFLGIDDYAYIKLFTFYVTYVGVTHFGLLDGIYVKYGAYNYEELPKEKFRGYFKILLIMQIIEAIILSIGVYIILDDINREIIMYYVVINMIVCNLTTLFAFVHQFTKRFKLFSINVVLTKLLYVIGSLIFIYFNMLGYLEFVILQTIISILILIIYIYYNKELVFGTSISIKDTYQDCKGLMKNGFFIMIGNFMGIIILGIDRLFVDKFFGIQDFAMYSFAYTLISLFFILLNALTTLVYPYLARAKKEQHKDVYEGMRVGLTAAMSITLGGYFIIKAIVIRMLPQYNGSLPILIYLVPTVIYSGQINILIANYYKVRNLTKEYTKNNVVALIIGVVTNIIAFAIFKSVISIAIATLISFILWLLYSDIYFKKVLDIKYIKPMILDILIVISFIFTASVFNWFLGGVIYVILLIIILFTFKEDLIKIVKYIKSEE